MPYMEGSELFRYAQHMRPKSTKNGTDHAAVVVKMLACGLMFKNPMIVPGIGCRCRDCLLMREDDPMGFAERPFDEEVLIAEIRVYHIQLCSNLTECEIEALNGFQKQVWEHVNETERVNAYVTRLYVHFVACKMPEGIDWLVRMDRIKYIRPNSGMLTFVQDARACAEIRESILGIFRRTRAVHDIYLKILEGEYHPCHVGMEMQDDGHYKLLNLEEF